MVPRVLFAFALLCASAAHARDRAVLIYPREHALFRRVFYTSHQQKLAAQLANRYDVETHDQIATEDDLFSIDVAGAKLLVISGHGDPFAMYMGSRDERTLDATDETRLRAFLARLAPDATIVLQS